MTEADELIANARTEANATAATAKAEADEMLANATAEAQNTHARAQAEADERLQRLQEELAARRDQGERRMREIQADTEAIWKQRGELFDDIRGMAGDLVDLTDAAAARIQRHEPAGPEKEMQEPQPEAETEPPGVATDDSTRPMPAVGSHEAGQDETRDEEAKGTASKPNT